MATRLLVLGEGDFISGAGPGKALDIFQGPLFSFIRSRMARGAWPGDVLVYIITAEYGLISATDIIAPYAKRLTPELADNAIYENFGRLCSVLAEANVKRILFVADELHLRAVIRAAAPTVQQTPAEYVAPTPAENANAAVAAWIANP